MHVNNIAGLIGNWGYECIFLGMLLEGLTIPFPGALFVVIAGAIAVQLKLNIWIIICSAILGYMLGALFPYYLAMWGGRKVLYNYGKYFALTPKTLNIAEFWFQKYGIWVVCLSRPFFFGNYSSYFAGLVKMPLGSFLLYTILGVIPWCVALGILGYFFGQASWFILKKYSWYALLIIPLVVPIYYKLKKIIFLPSDKARKE
ncbi:DedA family protein [Bacillota bacterium LX-D]|nr:DedA family protein [Bacillota bacterium LX-D]